MLLQCAQSRVYRCRVVIIILVRVRGEEVNAAQLVLSLGVARCGGRHRHRSSRVVWDKAAVLFVGFVVGVVVWCMLLVLVALFVCLASGKVEGQTGVGALLPPGASEDTRSLRIRPTVNIEIAASIIHFKMLWNNNR